MKNEKDKLCDVRLVTISDSAIRFCCSSERNALIRDTAEHVVLVTKIMCKLSAAWRWIVN